MMSMTFLFLLCLGKITGDAGTNDMDDMREVEVHLTFYNLQNVNKSLVVCIELQCDNCNLKNPRLTLFGKMRWDQYCFSSSSSSLSSSSSSLCLHGDQYYQNQSISFPVCGPVSHPRYLTGQERVLGRLFFPQKLLRWWWGEVVFERAETQNGSQP